MPMSEGSPRPAGLGVLLESCATRLRRGIKLVRSELASNCSRDGSVSDSDGGEETANTSSPRSPPSGVHHSPTAASGGRVALNRRRKSPVSPGHMSLRGGGPGDATDELGAVLATIEEALSIVRKVEQRAKEKASGSRDEASRRSLDMTSDSFDETEEPEIVHAESAITITKVSHDSSAAAKAKRQSKAQAKSRPTRSPRAAGISPKAGASSLSDDDDATGAPNGGAGGGASPWVSPFENVGDSDVAAWLVETYADEHKRETTGFDVRLNRTSSVVSSIMLDRRDSGGAGTGAAAHGSEEPVAGSPGMQSPRGHGISAGGGGFLGATLREVDSSAMLPAANGVTRTVYERSAQRSYPAFCSVRRFKEALNLVGAKHIPDINDPDFDIFRILEERGEERVFFDVVLNVLCQYNFIRSLQIDLRRLTNFVRTLKSCYRAENPYHNSIHAADVLQTTHIYMCVGDVKENFSDVELFAVLFAAMIHDVGHLGVNNPFLAKSRHPLAMIYNDISPLEAMHVSLAFHILAQPSCNFFLGSHTWTKEHHADFRQLVVETVLGTDMRHHSDLTSMVQNILADGKVEDNEVSQLFKSIVHAADMSNPMKPVRIYKQWIQRVIAEFWQQGDEERRRGVPISMMCDRETANVAKGQLGFIDFVVKPYMKALESVLPPIWIERLAENRGVMEAHVNNEDSELRAGIERFAARQWRDVEPDHPSSLLMWLVFAAEPSGRPRSGVVGPWLRPDDGVALAAGLARAVQAIISEIERRADRSAAMEATSVRWIRSLLAVVRGEVGGTYSAISTGSDSPHAVSSPRGPIASAAGKCIENFLITVAEVAGVELTASHTLEQLSPSECSAIVAVIAEDGGEIASHYFGHAGSGPSPTSSFLNTVVVGVDSGSWSPRDFGGGRGSSRRALAAAVGGIGNVGGGSAGATSARSVVSETSTTITPTVSFVEHAPPGSVTASDKAASTSPPVPIVGTQHALTNAVLGTVEMIVAMTRCWVQVSQLATNQPPPPVEQPAAHPLLLSTPPSLTISSSKPAHDTPSKVRRHLEPLPDSGRGNLRKLSGSEGGTSARSSTSAGSVAGEGFDPNPPTIATSGGLRHPPLLHTLLAPVRVPPSPSTPSTIPPPLIEEPLRRVPSTTMTHSVAPSLTAAYAGRTRRLDEVLQTAPRWERRLVLESVAIDSRRLRDEVEKRKPQ